MSDAGRVETIAISSLRSGSVAATYPEIAVWPITVITGAVAVVVGVGGYPISYSTWLAVDLAMHPLEPEEIADASRHAQASAQAQ